jgi:hypothetical protein
MSQAIVGRIFWKEIRVQRAFWAWILALGAFIQILPLLFGQAYYRSAVDYHFFNAVNIVVACCFAAGSTAIAFAGETEGRTKSLFQRLPVRAADLLAGKLGWSFLGTYTLLLILALTASLLGSLFPGYVAPNNAVSRLELSPQTSDFWISLIAPLPFLLVGVLCSLAMRDVLTTVTVAGALAAILVGVVSDYSRIAVVVVLVAVAVGDGLLVPSWLRDSLPSAFGTGWRLTRWRTAPGHSTLSVRSSIAWRRAGGSLLWKEWRQAVPLTLMVVVAGVLMLLLLAAAEWLENRAYAAGFVGFRWTKDWPNVASVCLTVVPLFFGVAAGRADRRDGAYRFLAHCGVSPKAHWLTKHAVWLGLAMVTVLWFLCGQRLTGGSLVTAAGSNFWKVAQSTANATFYGGASVIAGWPATLAIVLFEVALLYALGHLLSLVIPSAMTSLVLGLIGWVGMALLWLMVTELDIPFWWTIGLFPLIFLFAGWVRTHDYLVDRSSLAAWGSLAASLAIPLVGICFGVAVFRVLQIPAASLPIELQSPQPPAIEANALKQSLFVHAVKSLTGPPPQSFFNDPDVGKTADGWEFADVQTRDWVAANEPARKLALEAARQERGDFPDFEWTTRAPGIFSGEGMINLMWLLLDSARKLESEDKLEEALQNYVAVTRLGDDLKRSTRSHLLWRNPTRGAALDAMDRWAGHSKQTPELINRAISLFQQFEEDAPSEATAILRNWRTERGMFQNYVWRGNNPNQETRSAAETGLFRWCLPWELLRLQRFQDATFSTVLDAMQLVERQLRDRGFVDGELIDFNHGQVPFKWERTTLAPPSDSPSGTDWMMMPYWRVNQAALARMHFLVWAALDYRREHHKLPATLGVLVPAYFSWLPIDPWTGRGFQYEREGVPAPVNFLNRQLEKSQPFIASGGALDSRIEVSLARGDAIARVQLINREKRYSNEFRDGLIPVLIDPVPALPVLSPTPPHKSADRLPTKPAVKPAARKGPPKK